jgi:hypothetical protein
MSLSIRALSRVQRVAVADDADEEEGLPDDQDEVSEFLDQADGLTPGRYAAGKGGRFFSFEIWYKDYGDFMRELCRLALGVEWEEVCEDPDRFQGQPFVELLLFPYSSDGQGLGPATASKLHADFASHAARARRFFLKKEEWMWAVYRNLRRAFKLASDSGFVCYW